MAQRDINGTPPKTASDADTETRIATRPGSGNSPATPDSGNPTEVAALPGEMATRLTANSSLPQHTAPPSTGQSAVTSDSTATRLIEPGAVNHKTSTQPQSVGIGTTLKDRFILEEVIARGGMGVVYKARDLRMEEFRDREPYVAVKVLGDECKSNPDFFMALQRESRKAQKLAHPNIVTVYDFDCDGDMVFMTMEYLVGQTLDTYIRENQPYALNSKTAFSIIKGMGQGLAYAHKNGIVHCDFKPGNVFLTSDGTVKILDFGISRAAKQPDKPPQDATLFDAGKFGALTPPYASCEMLEGDDPDPRDDIYALACVTYELLTGRHPFTREKATVARNLHIKPARIKKLNKRQWKALLHGLAFDRSSRTPDVDQFLHEFNGQNQFLGLTRDWQIIAGIVFITLVSGALLLPYMTSTDYQQTGRTGIEKQEPIGGPVTLTQEEEDKISRLLEAAEVHFMVGYITEPPGSNAYDAYKQVLKINPHDTRAKAGLVKIADYYEKLAMESQAAGDTEKARSFIMAGLEVQPHHSGLIELNEETNPDAGWFDKVIRAVADLF
jgi:serine/threonine protein kinase